MPDRHPTPFFHLPPPVFINACGVFAAVLLFVLANLSPASLNAQVLIDGTTQTATVERHPVLAPDGKTLYFTREAHPENKGTDNKRDIWLRTRQADGSWGRAINPGTPINTFGAERLLAMNPDGTRLAVLRDAAKGTVELLEKAGRNWRVINTWPLPATAEANRDLTFIPNTLELIYSAASPDGRHADLYATRALNDGSWTTPSPLTTLNSTGDETTPVVAADNRTIYFKRNHQRWLRADDASATPWQVEIDAKIQSMAFPVGPTLRTRPAAVVDYGPDRGLRNLRLPENSWPAAGQVIQGYLPKALPLDRATAELTTQDGRTLAVRPYSNQQFTLYLRADERLVETTPPNTLPEGARRVGGLASNAGTPSRGDEATRLRRQIAKQEQKLYDLERNILWEEAARDTFPGSSRTYPTEGNRLDESRSELERMKAKFRQQQSERLEARDQRYAPAPTRTQSSRSGADRPAAYPLRDTSYISDRVRNDLNGAPYRSPYDDRSWENELRRGVPRPNPNAAAEPYPPRYPDATYQSARSPYLTAGPDYPASSDDARAVYEQQARELERLRAELRRLEGRGAVNQPAASAPRTYERSGGVYPTARPYSTPRPYGQPRNYTEPNSEIPAYPDQYGQSPATPYSLDAGSGGNYAASRRTPQAKAAGVPAAITFITNTAYPDGSGYGGLDQLVSQLRNATYAVDIRVLTPREMDPRNAQLLSEERAVSIRDYLQEKGIGADKARVIGFGNHETGNGGERVEIFRR